MPFDPTLPIPDRDSQPYWHALAEGRLEIQQCLDCGHWTWPPRPICPRCHNFNLEFRPVSGKGEVHAWVTPHRAFFPRLKDYVPFSIALVRLDEEPDVYIPGRMVSDEGVHQGTRVRAVPTPLTEEVGEVLWEIDDQT
jgi:uncharacterized OB-fold protein